MKTTKTAAASAVESPTGSPDATGLQVWFLVTKNEAVIGDAHHAEGKRMKLPKPAAEEAEKQGLGKIDGVVL